MANAEMTDTQFEEAVSRITDRLMDQRSLNIRAGWTDPPGPCRELIGVKPRISDSRGMLRSRVWTAARRTNYDDLRDAADFGGPH